MTRTRVQTFLLLLFIASGTTCLWSQNLIQNPSFEFGAPFPAPGYYQYMDPLNPGTDYVTSWGLGCPDAYTDNFTIVYSEKGLVAAGWDNNGDANFLQPHHGDRVAHSYLRYSSSNPNLIKRDHFRGDLTGGLAAGIYKFEGWQTAWPKTNRLSTGTVRFFLINTQFDCNKGDRMILETPFLDDLNWEHIGSCFTIASGEAGIYDAIEVRLVLPDNPTQEVHANYFLDDLSITLTNQLPDLSFLSGLLCQNELFVDVSMVNDYTLTIDPGTPNACSYSGNGHIDGSLNIAEVCNVSCNPASHILEISWDCGFTSGSATSLPFQVQCNPPQVELGDDYSVCDGQGFSQLDAGAGFVAYEWTYNGSAVPCPANSNPRYLDPCLTGTYCVTVSDAQGCIASDCIEITDKPNLIVNGAMSGIAVRSDLQLFCNQTNGCTNGTFCQVATPDEHCSSLPNNPTDHTNSFYNPFYMSILGSNQANTVIWYQDVPVESGKQYGFAAWVHYMGQNSSTRPDLKITINNQDILIVNGAFATNINNWTELNAVWTSSTTGMVRVEIIQTDAGAGNRLGIDDLSLKELCCQNEVPTGLSCFSTFGGINLTWAASSFPVTYQIRFIPNAEDCGCRGIQGAPGNPQPAFNNVYPAPSLDCYGWQVRSVCANGQTSDWSTMACQGKTSSCFGFFQKQGEIASETSFEVYPNPSSDQFSIELPAGTTVQTLRVYDLQGKQVSSLPIQKGANLSWKPADDLPSGMYLIQVEGQNFRQSKRIIYQKP